MENTRLKEDNKSQHKIIKLPSKNEEKKILRRLKITIPNGSKILKKDLIIHLSYNLFTVLIINRKTGYRFQ